MRRESPVQLLRPLDNSLVTGSLIVGATVDEVDEAVGLWSPYLDQLVVDGTPRPEHGHWEWDRKVRAVKGLPEYTVVGVSADNEMQALMMREEAWYRAKHPDQKGSPVVYIVFLATAPWNDVQLVPTPSFRGAGSILLTEAVNYSLSLGYKGRIGLHSLKQSEEFYRDRCGLVDLGVDPDPDHQGLRYFEFTKEGAEAFMKKQQRKK